MKARATRAVLAPDEAVYTLAQVATRLAVNRETLKRAIRRGELRALVLPGSAGTRITDRALQDYRWSLERGRPSNLPITAHLSPQTKLRACQPSRSGQ